MEPPDPLTGTTADWDAFIASIDPQRLEQERFGHPSPDERPGSAGWRRMLELHETQRHRFYTAAPDSTTIEEHELAGALLESKRYDRAFRPRAHPIGVVA